MERALVERAAAASLALVAVLAVALVAVPALRTAPGSLAGYPAERALTTAELAALMAGPALPTNTAVVASVTIESRPDVCPMDSRPTIGVVDGMGSQVCVMGSSVSEYLKQAAGAGTFAFRYMAPGYLGLIGEITPASASRLTFHVTDEWPLIGNTFLADGYLGATALKCDATETPDFGDILNPSGYEPCRLSWLSEDGLYAPVIENQGAVSPAESGGSVPSATPSIDLLGLHGKARYVAAGGARQIDSLPLETTRGVYVVRATTGPCPGASPMDSHGCATWQVLARVAADLTTARETASPSGSPIEGPETPIPEPTPSPTPQTPPVGYPADRALTSAELAAVMAGPALPVNTTLVAAVTIDSSESGVPGCFIEDYGMDYSTIGEVHGMATRICVFGGGFSPARVPGTFAFRYMGPGALYLMAEITPASSSRLLFRASEAWPWSINGWDTFLVGGYLIREPTGRRIADTPNGPAPSMNTYQTVQVDAAAGLDSMDPSQYGVFVVTCEPAWDGATSTSTTLPNGNGVSIESDGIAFHVVARVADISLPGEASPTPVSALSAALPTAVPNGGTLPARLEPVIP